MAYRGRIIVIQIEHHERLRRRDVGYTWNGCCSMSARSRFPQRTCATNCLDGERGHHGADRKQSVKRVVKSDDQDANIVAVSGQRSDELTTPPENAGANCKFASSSATGHLPSFAKNRRSGCGRYLGTSLARERTLNELSDEREVAESLVRYAAMTADEGRACKSSLAIWPMCCGRNIPTRRWRPSCAIRSIARCRNTSTSAVM